MYKLIAIDLDGTLLKNNGTISKSNVDAIERAKQKGVKVVLATGRPINGMKNYLRQLNIFEDDYVISFNGALVQTTRDEKIIGKKGLEISDLYKIADYITKSNEENGVAHVINEFILN